MRRLGLPDFLNRQPSTDLMQFSMNLMILWSPSRFRDTSSRRTSTAVCLNWANGKEKSIDLVDEDGLQFIKFHPLLLTMADDVSAVPSLSTKVDATAVNVYACTGHFSKDKECI